LGEGGSQVSQPKWTDFLPECRGETPFGGLPDHHPIAPAPYGRVLEVPGGWASAAACCAGVKEEEGPFHHSAVQNSDPMGEGAGRRWARWGKPPEEGWGNIHAHTAPWTIASNHGQSGWRAIPAILGGKGVRLAPPPWVQKAHHTPHRALEFAPSVKQFWGEPFRPATC